MTTQTSLTQAEHDLATQIAEKAALGWYGATKAAGEETFRPNVCEEDAQHFISVIASYFRPALESAEADNAALLNLLDEGSMDDIPHKAALTWTSRARALVAAEHPGSALLAKLQAAEQLSARRLEALRLWTINRSEDYRWGGCSLCGSPWELQAGQTERHFDIDGQPCPAARGER